MVGGKAGDKFGRLFRMVAAQMHRATMTPRCYHAWPCSPGESQECYSAAIAVVPQYQSQSPPQCQFGSPSQQQTIYSTDAEAVPSEKDRVTAVARVRLVVQSCQAKEVEKEQWAKTEAVVCDKKQFANNCDAGDNEKEMEVELRRRN